MRILLINVPHPAIGSRIPDDHLPPLGLLCVGGPLIDDGHEVRLLDGEFGPMTVEQLVSDAATFAPDAVLFGHSGSSSGHPVIASVARAVRDRLPDCHIIYGGVHPTYFWREILESEPWVDTVVRGEGEETARRLLRALAGQGRLAAGKRLSSAYAVPMLSSLGELDAAFRQADAYSKDTTVLRLAFAMESNFLFGPDTAAMRADPRFIGLVERLGLLGYWRASGQWPDFCTRAPMRVCEQMRSGRI